MVAAHVVMGPAVTVVFVAEKRARVVLMFVVVAVATVGRTDAVGWECVVVIGSVLDPPAAVVCVLVIDTVLGATAADVVVFFEKIEVGAQNGARATCQPFDTTFS